MFMGGLRRVEVLLPYSKVGASRFIVLVVIIHETGMGEKLPGIDAFVG